MNLNLKSSSPEFSTSAPSLHDICLPSTIGSLFHPAIVHLWGMFDLARDISPEIPSRCLWEFAIPLSRVRQLGLDDSQLRWLILKGFVQPLTHKPSASQTRDNGHPDLLTGGCERLSLGDDTLLTLSVRGWNLLRKLLAILSSASQASADVLGSMQSAADPHPIADPGETQNGMPSSMQTSIHGRGDYPRVHPEWDAQRHELWFNGVLVKRFKWPAINQEMILAAFEEERWPVQIDDPLPPQPEQDPKRRLSDTIKCLNRKQHNRLLHFRGDGTGEGVIWELAIQKRSPSRVCQDQANSDCLP